jgi:hypothetical protein
MRFVVFDDALQGNERGWMPDNFAAALRAPLAAIGVRVVRQRGSGDNSSRSGFQAHGVSANVHKAKSEKVQRLVESVLTFRAPQS